MARKAQKGTGGHGRRRLEGRGPTPKAEERTGHPAARRSRRSAAGRAATGGAAPDRRGGGDPDRRSSGRPARARSAPAADEVVAGRNAVLEALHAGVPATALYLATGLERDRRVTDALKLAAAASLPVLEGTRAELDRIAGGAPHQGLALHTKPYEYADVPDLIARAVESAAPPLLVGLDGVTDPHNLGAVVRSTAAFGGHGVVVPERRAAGVTAAAWKASAGALARLSVARTPNLSRAITTCADAGLMVVGLAAGGELALDDLELASGPLLLIVGSEGKGLSRLVAERCDVLVRIDLSGPVESLNASVAAGVALAEVARRRRAVTPG
jgi:23S rRNA (guanosine2251-2'-O)-methyltransferase